MAAVYLKATCWGLSLAKLFVILNQSGGKEAGNKEEKKIKWEGGGGGKGN